MELSGALFGPSGLTDSSPTLLLLRLASLSRGEDLAYIGPWPRPQRLSYFLGSRKATVRYRVWSLKSFIWSPMERDEKDESSCVSWQHRRDLN